MGMNFEFVQLLGNLSKDGLLSPGFSVADLGDQTLTVEEAFLRKALGAEGPLSSAEALYTHFGCTKRIAIDASGGRGSLAFDLNKGLRGDYGFLETFDLVTNLGTSEHCFNQQSVFANIHDLCAPAGGLMIHAVPSAGWVNHGFYSYSPRFFADLAQANRYDIVSIGYTVDVRPAIIDYALDSFVGRTSHDLMLYVVLRKRTDTPFAPPFDGVFAADSSLEGYLKTSVTERFRPYVRSNWRYVNRGCSVKRPLPWQKTVARILKRLLRALPR